MEWRQGTVADLDQLMMRINICIMNALSLPDDYRASMLGNTCFFLGMAVRTLESLTHVHIARHGDEELLDEERWAKLDELITHIYPLTLEFERAVSVLSATAIGMVVENQAEPDSRLVEKLVDLGSRNMFLDETIEKVKRDGPGEESGFFGIDDRP